MEEIKEEADAKPIDEGKVDQDIVEKSLHNVPIAEEKRTVARQESQDVVTNKFWEKSTQTDSVIVPYDAVIPLMQWKT